MLPKKHRLQKNADFQKVWKNGKSFYTKILGFRMLTNNLPFSRFGIVVGTKVTKKATARNKLKRQIGEVLRANLPKIPPGYDLIVSALPQSLDKTFQTVKGEVLAGLGHFKLRPL